MIQWSDCSIIVFSLFWKSHCSPCHLVTIQWSECFIVFSLFWKSHCSPRHLVTIQWSECFIVFSLFWKSHCSPCHPVMIQWSECSLSFHCFENLTVLHAIQSWSSDQIVHCLIVLKIPLFFMPMTNTLFLMLYNLLFCQLFCFSLQGDFKRVDWWRSGLHIWMHWKCQDHGM
jgi:hypothetical protein